MTKLHIFNEGELAYYDGAELIDCPYTNGSTEKIWWEDGWYAAQEFSASENKDFVKEISRGY